MHVCICKAVGTRCEVVRLGLKSGQADTSPTVQNSLFEVKLVKSFPIETGPTVPMTTALICK